MKCATCGSDNLFSGVQNVPYTYKGRSTVFTGIVGEHCQACGEVVMDTAQADEFLALADEFEASVDRELVEATPGAEPALIAVIRTKLHLTQREASEIFGGGVNAFSRYENGKSKAPRATVKLLRVLDAHPDLLAMIRD